MDNLFKAKYSQRKGGDIIMKRLGLFFLVAACVLVAAVAFAGIANTKHNLSTSGPGTQIQNASVCGPCHIPHGGQTGGVAPLWARKTPTSNYSLYGNGKTLSNTNVTSPGTHSLTCLSCHDGSIAINTITKNGVDTTIGNVTNNTAYVNSSGYIVSVANSAYQALIGTDLTNDHPVGVVYNSGAQYAGLTNSLTNQGSYYTPTGTNWRIYGGGDNSGKVECGSCHDPHTENNSGHSGETNKFLRGSVANICQDCHANK